MKKAEGKTLDELVKSFAKFLEKEVVFSCIKEAKVILRIDKNNANKFIIFIVGKEGHSRVRAMGMPLSEASEIILFVNFEEKDILSTKKDLYGQYDIEQLFKNFIQSLPTDSKKKEMYEKNRKTYRLCWMFEGNEK